MSILCFVATAQDKKVNKAYQNIKKVQLTTSSGSVVIKKSNSTETKVNLSYSYSDDEYKTSFEQRGDKLIIKDEFESGSHSGNASWELSIAKDVDLSITTGSGDMSLQEIDADVKLNLGSGDVEVLSSKGIISVNAGSGNIEVSNAGGEISVNTGSGDIKVDGGSGEYSLNAGSGNINLSQVKGIFSVNTGSGNVGGKNIAIEGKSRFNTGSGNARVTLDQILNHDITVNSGSGDALLNFNGTEISGEVVMTANKRNGEIKAPFKFDSEEIIDDGNSDERVKKTVKLGTKDIKIKVGTGSGTAEITK